MSEKDDPDSNLNCEENNFDRSEAMTWCSHMAAFNSAPTQFTNMDWII